MQRPLRTFISGGLIVLLALACEAGCEGRHSHEDFMPAESTARQALEKALAAWKEGKTAKEIDAKGPAINAFDLKWRAGEKLDSYEILSTKAEPNKPTWFTVKLNMKSPRREQTVRYVVIGIDPLSVCREEDYNKMSGM
jgi:hypothetical protein